MVIDNYTFVLEGDADPGQVVPLGFPINYGSGLQTSAMVNLGAVNTGDMGYYGTDLVSSSVGLSFPGSPGDNLYADLSYNLDSSSFTSSDPVTGAFLTNGGYYPDPETADFNFELFSTCTTFCYNYGHGSPGAPQYYYADHTAGADFSFFDLSGSGTAGDFGLLVQCSGTPVGLGYPDSIVNGCSNAGFSLNGVTFSSASNVLPTQYVSPCPSGMSGCDPASSWYFVFRNAAAVPEPGTWASMVMGFALVGGAVRSKRKRSVGREHTRA